MRPFLNAILMFVLPFQLLSQSIPEKRLPIIDMHLHVYGSPESFLEHRGDAKAIAALPTQIPPLDMKLEDANNLPSAYGKLRYQYARKVLSPEVTGDALMKQTVNLLRRYNIYAVANGKLAEVKTWVAYEPERIMPALKLGHPDEVPPEQLRNIMSKGEIRVLGEITSQYFGIAPNDSSIDYFFALSEEFDIPVGIHIGNSNAGIPVIAGGNYRAALTHPLALEPVLLKYPKLRIYVMHAGWPMLDEMLHLLWSYPQAYVDISVLGWLLPEKEFHFYLKRLVDAGFGSRIMYGSDQMIWPEAIEVSIGTIESADFLTHEQKRDIFYNNAARFLRLSDKEIAKHHGK